MSIMRKSPENPPLTSPFRRSQRKRTRRTPVDKIVEKVLERIKSPNKEEKITKKLAVRQMTSIDTLDKTVNQSPLKQAIINFERIATGVTPQPLRNTVDKVR